MLVLEREIFELRFDAIQTQSVGKGRKDIERFAHNLILSRRRHRIEGAHIVESVGDFHQDDANVVAHCEENLLERLCLHRSTVTQDTTAHFRDTFHDISHLLPEEIGDIFARIVGILHHIVQQGRTNGGRSHAHLLTHHLRHGNGVEDVQLSASASHTAVGSFRKVERFGDHLHFFAMAGGKIGVEQVLKRHLHLLFFLLFAQYAVVVCHSLMNINAEASPPEDVMLPYEQYAII